MLKLITLCATALLIAGPAEAHTRHHHNRPRQQTIVVTPWLDFISSRPRQRVRLNEHCVYKPWSNKTICKY